MSQIMDQFEQQCGTLSTQTSYMDVAMSNTGQLTTPGDQVDELIQQVADAHGLDVKMALGSNATPSRLPAPNAVATSEQDEELTSRLNALRGSHQ